MTAYYEPFKNDLLTNWTPLFQDYEPDYIAYFIELESLEATMANVDSYDDWFVEESDD